MTSTLWFWILLAFILLIILWELRKFIGRIIIVCVVLFVVFWIFKRIAPSSANTTWYWIKNIPVKTTNFVNKELLNKDIVIPLSDGISNTVDTVSDALTDGVENAVDKVIDNVEIIDDAVTNEVDEAEELIVDTTEISENTEEEALQNDEEVDESRYSWFARLFKKNKKQEVAEETSTWETMQDVVAENVDDEEDTQEDKVEVKLSSWAVVIETTNASWEKVVEEIVTLTGKNVSNTTWKVTTGANKEDTPVYLPSNPHNSKNSTGSKATTGSSTGTVITTKRWGLTAAEIQEINTIFN